MWVTDKFCQQCVNINFEVTFSVRKGISVSLPWWPCQPSPSTQPWREGVAAAALSASHFWLEPHFEHQPNFSRPPKKASVNHETFAFPLPDCSSYLMPSLSAELRVRLQARCHRMSSKSPSLGKGAACWHWCDFGSSFPSFMFLPSNPLFVKDVWALEIQTQHTGTRMLLFLVVSFRDAAWDLTQLCKLHNLMIFLQQML